MNEFVVGDWTVFPKRNTIARGSSELHLEPRVMDLLVYLCERPDEVLSVDQIIADVWPHAFITDGALLTAISALRKALGDNRRNPIYIETIPRRGYRLVAKTSALPGALAVMPIENRIEDSEMAYLAEGVTDGLIAELGHTPALRVIAGRSSLAEGDARSVGRSLGARLVLDGTLRMDSGLLSVTVRLLQVDGDKALLEERFVRPLSELSELLLEISRRVGDSIHDRLRHVSERDDRPADPDAVIEHLRGRYHWARSSPTHLDKALTHFERAVEIDPQYVPAYVGIADVSGARGYWGSRDAREVRREVQTAAQHALAIDPKSPEALTIMAAYHQCFDHDWSAAESALRRAIRTNPNSCHARLIYALYLGTTGRQQAIDEIERAVRIDPLNPAVLMARALIHASGGRRAEAASDVDELLALAEGHRPGLQLRAELHWQINSEEALPYERAVWQSDPDVLAALQRQTAVAAFEAAAELLCARAAEHFVPPYEVARLLALAGDHGRAFDVIQRALGQGNFMRVDFLQLAPVFAPLRGSDGYRSLAASLGLPAPR